MIKYRHLWNFAFHSLTKKLIYNFFKNCMYISKDQHPTFHNCLIHSLVFDL